MGQKSARASEAGTAATHALLTDLAELGAVTSRPMFGGHGVFLDGVMFACVDSAGNCFLRADPAAAAVFEAAGSGRHGRMPYWRIPADVRAESVTLLEWAARALATARAATR